jgi:2-polyprenyl-3-methyl-5-hydroxy-6-metoxy-1,4-benzoquinol methylase
MKVLEIGCGPGDFLLRIKERIGAQCVGIELNNKAIDEANEKGLTVFHESIKQHARVNKEVYDVVCSFQVLEHISNVNEFLEAQISCLRTGGTLIISVPNNDSWLKRGYNILNMPPHHMGLWNKKSLKNLAKLFNLKIDRVAFEPLQEYHVEYYNQTHRDLLLNFKFIPKRLWPYIIQAIHLLSSKSYNGFTIQIAYCKK